MTQDMNLLQLTVEQRAQAMAVFDECADLREFGCRMLEAVMNAVMDADAQDACGAARGERSEARENSRNGYRQRTLRTAAGDLELAIPKLRRGTYYPEGILGRYTRVEASVVALVREMYVAGVSTRKVERVAEGLGVSSLSSSEVSRLCSELDESAAAFRSRPIEGDSPYVWLDATYMKCQVDGRYVSQALVTAIGLDADGRKRFLGAECVDAESRESWRGFLEGLRARGRPHRARPRQQSRGTEARRRPQRRRQPAALRRRSRRSTPRLDPPGDEQQGLDPALGKPQRGRVQEKASHADPDHDRLGHRHRAGAGKKRDLLVKKVFDAKKREVEEGERRHGNVFSNYAHGLPALLPLLFARHSSQAKNAAKSARLK